MFGFSEREIYFDETLGRGDGIYNNADKIGLTVLNFVDCSFITVIKTIVTTFVYKNLFAEIQIFVNFFFWCAEKYIEGCSVHIRWSCFDAKTWVLFITCTVCPKRSLLEGDVVALALFIILDVERV